MTIRTLASAVVILLPLAPAWGQPAPDGPPFAFVQVSSPEQRLRYLAEARIWSDPGPLTPEDLSNGPKVRLPPAVERAGAGETVPCIFVKPGKALGGKTPKFTCRTPGGATIRVKYTDGTKEGNREVFSLVAATRLLWALGFDADPVFPIAVDCQDCPEDPMSGEGPRGARRYTAVYQPRFSETVMVDGTDPDQGWRWGEIDEAIDALPPGPLRARQHEHFDALTLLGVFLQHGDRKPEQQRLACGGAIDRTAGEVHPVAEEDGHAYSVPVFFEHPGARACTEPIVAVQDVGATMGGAGRTSNPHTAKMHLESWAARPVFHSAERSPAGMAPECHGELTVSMAAGHGSRGNPRIGEAGRQFLLQQFRRLSDDHLRAILTAARVDQMGEEHSWKDPLTGQAYAGVDAWVMAFKDKVRQVEERRCAP